jgi:hypothetical protein
MEDKLPNPFDVFNERLTRIENLLLNILVENQNDLAGSENNFKN